MQNSTQNTQKQNQKMKQAEQNYLEIIKKIFPYLPKRGHVKLSQFSEWDTAKSSLEKSELQDDKK